MQNCHFKKIRILFFIICVFNFVKLNSQLELGVKGGLSFNSGENESYFFDQRTDHIIYLKQIMDFTLAYIQN